jgi:uncharacterized damage-inducible protein DinB
MNPIDAVRRCLDRDLAGFEAELAAFPDDATVWQEHPAMPNTTGTLVLHAVGNLRHFIGATLGGDGYVRDRDAEFARRDVPRAELLEQLREARAAVGAVLASLDPARLDEAYPLEVAGHRPVTGTFLVHLATHLAYHLGQADFHRRVVTGNRAPVGAMSPLAPVGG